MLSFGIEYERAFSIAFWSARLLAESPPPSFAATMIARASLEKSLPRFASAAPFLCLIEDHLLCPDTGDLLEEQFVQTGVVGQLRMERRDEESALAGQDWMAVHLGEHLDFGPDLLDPRGADEDRAQRPALAGEVEVGLERGDLAPEGVPPYRDVDEAEMVAVEHDHPGAGAEHRPVELAQRLVEAVEPHQARERGRLAARDDEPVEPVELLGDADLDNVGAEAPQHRRVLAEVPLHGKNADPKRLHGGNGIPARCRVSPSCSPSRPRSPGAPPTSRAA